MPSRNLGAVLLVSFLVAGLFACQGWWSLEPPFAQAVAEREPKRIRLTLTDSSRIEMRQPVSESDSLVGRDKGDTRVAVAVEHVVSVDERRTDAMATGVLLIAIGAFAYYWIHAYCCTGT